MEALTSSYGAISLRLSRLDQHYIWLHKPPAALWMMAGSMHIFGVNELALRLPSIILSTLSIALTYQIAVQLFPKNKNIALLAAFFHSVNGMVIQVSGGRVATDHIDTLLMFWVELGVWVAVTHTLNNNNKQRIFWIIAITSVAILTKWLVALFIPFLFVCFEYLRNKKTIYVHLGEFLFVGLCSLVLPALWANYLHANYPLEFSWEQSLHRRHFYEAIEGHSGEWWYYLENARIHLNEGVYIVFIYFVYTVFKNRDRSDIFLLIWITIPYLLFSLFATKMTGYVMISFAPVFIITAKFAVFCWEKNTTIGRILTATILLLALRYCVERVKPFYLHPDSILQKEMVNDLLSVVPNQKTSIVFNNPHYIETMFYTNIVSRRGIPTSSDIDTAKQHFESIAVINDGNDLPAWVLNDSVVQVIKVTW